MHEVQAAGERPPSQGAGSRIAAEIPVDGCDDSANVALATAEVAMERRQVRLDDGMKQLLRAAWQRTAGARA